MEAKVVPISVLLKSFPTFMWVVKFSFYCFSGYMKAKKHLQEGNYGSIIECCQNELANPLTPYKVESLLLRATLYQLRGESKKAMDDLTDLINIENSPLKVRYHHHFLLFYFTFFTLSHKFYYGCELRMGFLIPYVTLCYVR